jgi:hypothetical protein
MCGDSFFEDGLKEEEEIRRSVFLGPASAAVCLVGHKTARARRRSAAAAFPGLALLSAWPSYAQYIVAIVAEQYLVVVGWRRGKGKKRNSIEWLQLQEMVNP